MDSRIVGKLNSILLYVLAIAIGIGVTTFFLNSYFLGAVSPGSKEQVSFLINPGWVLKDVSKELESKKLIKNWWSFYFLGRLKKNELKVIRSGEYSFSPGETPLEILEKLIKEEIVFHEITVPEGATVRDVVQLMQKSQVVTLAQAEAAINDVNLLGKLRITTGSFEGYLFPETYRFSRPDTAELIITTMVEHGNKKRTLEMEVRARELGYSMYQILTLASIIEKETGARQDRKKISSVFHNRLKVKMPLQSDPTVIYGLPNFNGNLTKADLATPSPYNTYMNQGLPPTPICNPGMESIEAALYPDDTDYLYFVSRGDGTSQFSSSYKEHREAVKRYQIERRAGELENVLKE